MRSTYVQLISFQLTFLFEARFIVNIGKLFVAFEERWYIARIKLLPLGQTDFQTRHQHPEVMKENIIERERKFMFEIR